MPIVRSTRAARRSRLDRRTYSFATRRLRCAVEVREAAADLGPGHRDRGVVRSPRIVERDRLVRRVVADHGVGVAADDAGRGRRRSSTRSRSILPAFQALTKVVKFAADDVEAKAVVAWPVMWPSRGVDVAAFNAAVGVLAAARPGPGGSSRIGWPARRPFRPASSTARWPQLA